MEINLKASIKNFLDNLESLQPIKTQLEANYVADSGIKAVIFDIYGTLLISSSGDIDQADLQQCNIQKALEGAGYKFDSEKEDEVCTFFLEQLPVVVSQHQEVLRENGHPFPDIDIVAVWAEMVDEAIKKELLLPENGTLLDLIIIFEILSNKVYPMPGMFELLSYLKEKDIPIGIVSNAQFYTPVIMNYFLDKKLDGKAFVSGFEEDLSVFSYKELRAKPDTELFEVLKPQLRRLYGVMPEEAVFVGNDMLKDIYTASESGFKTILFAGDERSLRLRETDKRTVDLRPDYVVDHLEQIKNIVV